MDAACVVIDRTWGPWAGACRGGLDFTLTFEASILTILPCTLLILVAPWRIWSLKAQSKKVKKSRILSVKQTLIGVLALIKLVSLIFWSLSQIKTGADLVAAALAVVNLLPLCALSYYEHMFNAAPSLLLNIYILLTALCEIVKVRTLWLMQTMETLAIVESLALGVTIMLAIAETQSKHQILRDHYKNLPREALSGLYGRGLFLWLREILWHGYHRLIRLDELFSIQDEESANAMRDRLKVQWANCANKSRGEALIWALFKSVPQYFLVPIIPRIGMLAVTLTQPLLLQRLLDFVQGQGYSERSSVGYSLIGAFALLYGLTSLLNAWYAHAANKLALQLRSLLVDAIYSKMLDVRAADLDNGQVTTLLNVDIEHIMQGALMVHEIWASLIMTGAAMYLIYWKLQLAILGPLICAVGLTFVNTLYANPIAKRQVAWLGATERRIKSTMAALSNFKEVKMLGLSGSYMQSLQELRRDEVTLARKFRRIMTFVIVTSVASTQLSLLAAYGAFAIISRMKNIAMNADTLFTSLALIQISTAPLFLLIQGTPTLVSAFKCLGRIQKYLQQDVLTNSAPSHSSSDLPSNLSSNDQNKEQKEVEMISLGDSDESGKSEQLPLALLEMHEASFSWSNNLDERPAILQANLTVSSQTQLAIIGSVGSGKSSLLKSILGELHLISGNMKLRPGIKLAFCAQEPWLLDDTIQANILGGLGMNQSWYNTVIAACALNYDLDRLPNHDETMVGHEGSALSGGQRQRIALARALYSRPELLLLDDIFSSQDKRTKQSILTNIFADGALLSTFKCSVVTITHSAPWLSHFNDIIVMDNGRISHQGSYQQLSLNGLLPAEALSDRSSDGDQGELVEEEGDHSAQLPDQISATANNQAEVTQLPSDFSVYSFFTRSMGIQGVFIFFALAAALATEMSFQNVWLEKWASSNNPNSLVLYISVFTGLVFSGLGLLYVLCYLFFDILLTSSSLDLYFGQLKTLMRAPVSYVLSAGSTTIANRFIQDIMLIDNELPMAFVNTTTSFFIAIGETVIILLASKYLLISVPFLLTALWLLQRFYLRTSKQLRLMDIESKAPLSAFLNDTINGLASIRAFGRTREFQLNNRKRLEQSQKAMYMLYSVQVWLKLVLDFVVAIMAVAVASLAVNLRSSQSLGFLGLALVNLISLSSSFKYLITFWTELEASIGAVARIQQFKSSLPPEDESQHPPPAVHWPTRGDISFRSTSASHQVNASLVLSDLSLNISHGQKVAICGRSGSGKSSLLGTLLRTTEVTNGSIQVDQQDILKLPRDELRRRFITLPQKPVFLPGSIRQNINIWTDLSQSNDDGHDERIKDALVKVGIWDVLVTAYQQSLSPSESFPAVGLQTETTTMPQGKMVSNPTAAVLGFEFDPTVALSHGQRQLFSLARLIFQCNSPNLNSPIVLLDEITSSIDYETGMDIRRILHEVLQHKTVLEVIHLLDEKTVKDQFDLIVVMDSGRIVETGVPGELLLQHGVFRRLIDAGKSKSRSG